MKRTISIFILSIFMAVGMVGQQISVAMTQPTGINDRPLTSKPENEKFSFLAMGHIYGAHDFAPQSYDRSPYLPSTRLLYNLDRLKDMDPDFVISLGDMVSAFNEENLYMLEKTFLQKFNVPVFNAVGGHDLPKNGEKGYKEKFGEVSYHFIYDKSLFIVLNSQSLDFNDFKKTLTVLEKADINNVFVCMHELKFLAKDEDFKTILKNSNARESFDDKTEFVDEYLPLLKNLSEKYQVYILGGDIGADVEWSYSIFYHKEGNLHYVATGLGDTVNDAVLRFDIAGKKVKITPISLDGQAIEDISYYGLDFWSMYFSPIGKIYRKTKFNFKYILAGFIAGINVMLLPLAILYFRKKIK